MLSLRKVQTEEEYKRIFPLLFKLVEMEEEELSKELEFTKSIKDPNLYLEAWRKSSDYGYSLFYLDKDGQVAAVAGLTEIYDPISVKP